MGGCFMSKITDYAFLFQKSFGTSGVNAIGSFQLSQLNSSSVQAQLKAAGINTNSKQYNDKYVATRSEGEEPYRKVVVYLKK